MSWLSLLLQLLALRKGLHESRSMAETARYYAEKGKRTLAAFLAAAIAALFFFAALLVAVIELGLQIDRGSSLYYSGLMGSATILAGFGLLLAGVAYGLGRSVPAASPVPSAGSPRAERIKDLLEEFLVSFLSQLAKPREPRGRDPGPPTRD
jgi:hypothetical protein